MKMLKRIFYLLWDFSLFITREGSWKLRSIEMLVLGAIKGSLRRETLESVNLQMKQSYFVQRMNDSRINSIFFYEKNENYKIMDDDFQDLLLKVELFVDEKKENAHVTFFNGYVATIEFKRPKKSYLKKNIRVGGVKLGRPDKSHALAVDRLEHGDKYKR